MDTIFVADVVSSHLSISLYRNFNDNFGYVTYADYCNEKPYSMANIHAHNTLKQ